LALRLNTGAVISANRLMAEVEKDLRKGMSEIVRLEVRFAKHSRAKNSTSISDTLLLKGCQILFKRRAMAC